MTMATNLEVANSALYDINVEPIMSFSDPSKEAQVITSKFQGVVDEVLSTNPWNCNRRIVILNHASVDEKLGWENVFTIPNDCLYVRAVVPYSDISELTPETIRRFSEYSMNQTTSQLYMRSEKYVYTNDANVLLVYSQRITDCSKLPAYVARVVARALAADIAYALTQDRQVRADQVALYDNALRLARAANAKEENTYTPVSTLLTVRGD